MFLQDYKYNFLFFKKYFKNLCFLFYSTRSTKKINLVTFSVLAEHNRVWSVHSKTP